MVFIYAACWQDITAYVSVGFPLGLLSKWFLRSHSSWDALVKGVRQEPQEQQQNLGSMHGKGLGNGRTVPPRLLVMGTADQFTALETLQGLVHEEQNQEKQQQRAGVSSATGSLDGARAHVAGEHGVLELLVIDGCDHFFGGRHDELADRVLAWVGSKVEVHNMWVPSDRE